jgi:hypothetical protein
VWTLRKKQEFFMPIPTSLKRKLGLAFLIAPVAAAPVWAEAVREPIQTSVTFDVGQIHQSSFEDADELWLQRTGVTITQAVSLNEDRLRLIVGIGGMFFNSYPEAVTVSYQRSLKFGPGISQAQAITKLGPLDNPWGAVHLGFIPFKYNPDAKNLGEYLLRSSAYPNVIYSGGYNMINSANMLVLGATMEVKTGPVDHSLVLSIERNYEPNGDLTPSYLVAYKPHPAIEIGGGITLSHLISVKPSLTTPDGKISTGTSPSNRYDDDVDTVVTDPADTTYSNYTFKGTKLMARASINFQTFLQWSWLGPEDLKLYSEAALLGVKNYPYYYDNRWHRIPVMVGLNLPTFRFGNFKAFDALAVEAEYRRADFTNSVAISYVDYTLPLPYLGFSQNPADYEKTNPRRGPWYRDEGIKWSVYAKRGLIPGLDLYAQVASDHIRPMKFTSDGALVPTREPLTLRPSEWYYLVRLQMGI